MTKQEFLGLIDEAMERDSGTVAEESSLDGLPEWDSLAVVSFIALVDERLSIQLDPKELAAASTAKDLVALVEAELHG